MDERRFAVHLDGPAAIGGMAGSAERIPAGSGAMSLEDRRAATMAATTLCAANCCYFGSTAVISAPRRERRLTRLRVSQRRLLRLRGGQRRLLRLRGGEQRLFPLSSRERRLFGLAAAFEAALALFEQGDALRQDLRLLGEPGDGDREVQQQDEHEPERDHEQRGGRVVDAERRGDRPQQAAPEAEPEQHDGAEQPEHGVALEQPPAADELEQDDEQREGGDDRDDLDADPHQSPVTGASSPGSTTGLARTRPTEMASRTLTM